MFDLKAIIEQLANNQSLSQDEAYDLFDYMVSGKASGPQIGALLMGLRQKGETIEEIAGAAQAMRGRMLKICSPPGAIDLVGTGGDNAQTYNISTCAAFIVAGAGIPVAKHGNRALSSRSGAADVLSALGVNLDLDPHVIERCIREAGIGFMFAPSHHPALKQVMPARIDLATRTIFNVLGPLINPAGVKHHLIGVYSAELVDPIAQVLKEVGSERALVVHGLDGLDEISTVGITKAALLANDHITSLEISPDLVDLPVVSKDELRGGDAKENARALSGVLNGEAGPYRDIALFNAAGGVLASGRAENWQNAFNLAKQSLDQGRAKAVLDKLIFVSNTQKEFV